MKASNKFKLIGIAAAAAVIGFTFIGCGNGGGGTPRSLQVQVVDYVETALRDTVPGTRRVFDVPWTTNEAGTITAAQTIVANAAATAIASRFNDADSANDDFLGAVDARWDYWDREYELTITTTTLPMVAGNVDVDTSFVFSFEEVDAYGYSFDPVRLFTASRTISVRLNLTDIPCTCTDGNSECAPAFGATCDCLSCACTPPCVYGGPTQFTMLNWFAVNTVVEGSVTGDLPSPLTRAGAPTIERTGNNLVVTLATSQEAITDTDDPNYPGFNTVITNNWEGIDMQFDFQVGDVLRINATAASPTQLMLQVQQDGPWADQFIHLGEMGATAQITMTQDVINSIAGSSFGGANPVFRIRTNNLPATSPSFTITELTITRPAAP